MVVAAVASAMRFAVVAVVELIGVKSLIKSWVALHRLPRHPVRRMQMRSSVLAGLKEVGNIFARTALMEHAHDCTGGCTGQ